MVAAMLAADAIKEGMRSSLSAIFNLTRVCKMWNYEITSMQHDVRMAVSEGRVSQKQCLLWLGQRTLRAVALRVRCHSPAVYEALAAGAGNSLESLDIEQETATLARMPLTPLRQCLALTTLKLLVARPDGDSPININLEGIGTCSKLERLELCWRHRSGINNPTVAINGLNPLAGCIRLTALTLVCLTDTADRQPALAVLGLPNSLREVRLESCFSLDLSALACLHGLHVLEIVDPACITEGYDALAQSCSSLHRIRIATNQYGLRPAYCEASMRALRRAKIPAKVEISWDVSQEVWNNVFAD